VYSQLNVVVSCEIRVDKSVLFLTHYLVRHVGERELFTCTVCIYKNSTSYKGNH